MQVFVKPREDWRLTLPSRDDQQPNVRLILKSQGRELELHANEDLLIAASPVFKKKVQHVQRQNGWKTIELKDGCTTVEALSCFVTWLNKEQLDILEPISDNATSEEASRFWRDIVDLFLFAKKIRAVDLLSALIDPFKQSVFANHFGRTACAPLSAILIWLWDEEDAALEGTLGGAMLRLIVTSFWAYHFDLGVFDEPSPGKKLLSGNPRFGADLVPLLARRLETPGKPCLCCADSCQVEGEEAMNPQVKGSRLVQTLREEAQRYLQGRSEQPRDMN